MKRLAGIFGLVLTGLVRAEPPDIEYIFPAGGQRGTTVPVRIGGYYFHGQANFEMLGSGVKTSSLIKLTKTVWFEGPMILQPLSQRGEDYPKDHAGQVEIKKNATLGFRLWRCWTSQGTTKLLRFIIGDLPEVMEVEVDGRPMPQQVTLPLTANGRIFPREDIDIWSFEAKAGETIICDAAAKRFGSPLVAVLSIQDPDGNPVHAKKTVRGGDPIHWFKAAKSGRYRASIHDAKYWGLQNCIYRLTLKRGPQIMSAYPLGGQRGTTIQAEFNGPGLLRHMAPVTLKPATEDRHTASIKNLGSATFVVGEHPEHLEPAPSPVSVPSILNGRIGKPGETDTWQIQLTEKDKITLDLAAAQLGSPLDAMLSIHDTEGKQLSANDDRAKGQSDPRLNFTAPKAGVYQIRVSERFASRGGPSFAYRLTVINTVTTKPDFKITLDAVHFNLIRTTDTLRGDSKPSGPKLKINVERSGGFKGEILLAIKGLPGTVQFFNTGIAANKKFTELQFAVPRKTKIAAHRIFIKGIGLLGDRNATRTASHSTGLEHVLIGIVPAVPFKHVGQYRIVTGLPGGTTFLRDYRLERGGFKGPLTVRLADKQIRHLQGVTDRYLNIPADAVDFKFPVDFPPRVEVGRTSRVQVMLIGELTDFDGTRHQISYTSNARDDQLISVAAAGMVSVKTQADSFTVPRNGILQIPVSISREPVVRNQPMLVELILPEHVEGILAEPATLAAGQSVVTLKIKNCKSSGPFNAPFKIRAHTTTGPRHVADKEIELFVAEHSD